MSRQQSDAGDQSRSQSAGEYSRDKRQRFPQLSAHQLFPRRRAPLKLIRLCLKASSL
jgi:hypothetical protein